MGKKATTTSNNIPPSSSSTPLVSRLLLNHSPRLIFKPDIYQFDYEAKGYIDPEVEVRVSSQFGTSKNDLDEALEVYLDNTIELLCSIFILSCLSGLLITFSKPLPIQIPFMYRWVMQTKIMLSGKDQKTWTLQEQWSRLTKITLVLK